MCIGRKMRGAPLLLALLLAGLLCLAPAVWAAQFIKLGSVLPLTGRMAAGGKDVKAGYELAVAHINADGGVMVKSLGKKLKLKLLVLDDESDPVKTASRMEKLKSVDKVNVYLGGFSSLLNVAGMAIAEKNRIPWVGVTIAVEAPIRRGFKYTFVPFGMSGTQTKAFFDLLDSIPAGQRPKIVANFELQTDWGRECGAYIKKYAKARGYKVVVKKYAPVTKDFSSLILAAKAAGAEALFSVPTPPQSIALVKQMKELAFAPKVTCFIRGPDISTFGMILGKDANYLIADGNWHHSMPYPGNDRLKKDYRAKYPGVKTMGSPVGPAYAAVQLVVKAIEKAGSLDPKKIRDALATMDAMTVKGRIKFRKNNTAQVIYGLVQWQNGVLKLIWPPKVAPAKLQLAPPWDKR